MKKNLIALSVALLASTAWAQTAAPVANNAAVAVSPPVSGAVTSSVQARPVTAMPSVSTALPPLPTGANPFTGVTRAQSEMDKTEEELKRLRQLSSQKLALQRDELEALKIELDKKKVWDALNPPKPVIVPVEPAKAPPTSSSNSSTSSASKSAQVSPKKTVQAPKENVEKERPVIVKAPTPPQIIAPTPAKFETPSVVGIVDLNGRRVAMLKHDGQTLQATTGSVVGGKSISAIAQNGVQWGGTFLRVGQADSPPSIAVTDTGRSTSTASIQPIPTPVIPPPMASSYSVPTGGIAPQGATRNTVGATGPSGVLQLPPPPPSMTR